MKIAKAIEQLGTFGPLFQSRWHSGHVGRGRANCRTQNGNYAAAHYPAMLHLSCSPCGDMSLTRQRTSHAFRTISVLSHNLRLRKDGTVALGDGAVSFVGQPDIGCGREASRTPLAQLRRRSTAERQGGSERAVPRVPVTVHAEFEVWSDPPADLIQRAIVDDLAHRFGADQVMATPVARYATPDALDVIRFDVDESSYAVVDARWTLLTGSSDRLAASRREWIEVPSGDAADPAKRVTAPREAVAMLADRIDDAVAAARRER
jgi:hypothetical protein